MVGVKIGPALPDRGTLDVEIARLRGLDVDALRARWRTVFRGSARPYLSRHLLFRVLAHWIQTEQLGNLDATTARVLASANATTGIAQLEADLTRMGSGLKPGTVLTREWDRHLQHVMVLGDGFSWSGTRYDSLSKVAYAITGTKWNGPRFFGLRDRPRAGAGS